MSGSMISWNVASDRPLPNKRLKLGRPVVGGLAFVPRRTSCYSSLCGVPPQVKRIPLGRGMTSS